eukprot:PhF_6_TR41296/c9_g2_i1/m.62514
MSFVADCKNLTDTGIQALFFSTHMSHRTVQYLSNAFPTIVPAVMCIALQDDGASSESLSTLLCPFDIILTAMDFFLSTQQMIIDLMKEFKKRTLNTGDKVYSVDLVFAKALREELNCIEFKPIYT